MLIPNVRVDILATNSAGAMLLVPSYVVPLVRAVWGPRLDAQNGVTVTPVPIGAFDRYREVSSIAAEEALWRGKYGELFAKEYPNGLREEIGKLLKADAIERKAYTERQATPQNPHESFIAAGCTAEQACALQTAGFATLADLPDDFLRVAEVPGISPVLAEDLIALKNKPAPAIKQADPLAAASKPGK